MRESPRARFDKKVLRTDSCWEWVGARVSGYGQFWISGRMRYAHIVAWEFANGPVPPEMEVMHSCDNPSCVRLAHLSVGTHLENMRDRDRKGRRVAPTGEDHGGAKLTEEQAKEVLQRRRAGELLESIADSFGITKTSVSRLTRGLAWKHLQEEGT